AKMHFLEEYQPLLVKEIKDTKRTKLPHRTLVLAALAACVGGTFQYGYNVSVINAPTTYVQTFINQTWQERYQTTVSEDILTLLWSTIVSIFTVGGFIGVTIGGTLSVKIGRKGTLLTNNIFALTAALLMGLSYPTGLFELLIIGRFFTGINAGIGLCVQTMYLGESAPTALRGAVGAGTAIFITVGIFLGQVVGLNTGIKRVSCSVLSVALKQLHGPAYKREWEDIVKEKNNLASFHPKKPWELLSDRSVRWQVLTIVLLNCAQQLNGINAIYFYANYLFQEAGIPADKRPYVTIGAGACECITALTCGMLIERLGRRVLIMGGYTLMSVCCILFTLTLTFQDANPVIPYLSMVCVFAFILSFGLGPGGVTNILTTELFTQTARPAAYVIAGSVNWLCFFFISLVFPFIVIGLQQYCFLVFLAICSFIAMYIFFVVPETKNKTFLEIQNMFGSFRKRNVFDADGFTASLSSTSM
uniref:Major facilitator superfamily (MFS) profile domain-containing protein n=1 Tax=Mola mola TaxID=94237 RepID=A0A3Q3XJ56_MOLML